MTYLTGWFLIDILSIFPFTFILKENNSNLNSLGKGFRLPNIYRKFRLGK